MAAPIISPTLKPDISVLHGYTGGMALYVANWNSATTLFRPVSIEFVLRYEQTYTPNNN